MVSVKCNLDSLDNLRLMARVCPDKFLIKELMATNLINVRDCVTCFLKYGIPTCDILIKNGIFEVLLDDKNEEERILEGYDSFTMKELLIHDNAVVSLKSVQNMDYNDCIPIKLRYDNNRLYGMICSLGNAFVLLDAIRGIYSVFPYDMKYACEKLLDKF